MKIVQRVIVLLSMGCFLPVSSTFALEPVFKSRLGGVAIKGFDPVAYFTQSNPVKGEKAISFEWKGATWRFSSADHRDQFKETPEAFAPQYGGYCAYAVSEGSTASIDPDAWTIVDGKLYLNYSKKIQAKWAKDIPGRIKKADENWPGLLEK